MPGRVYLLLDSGDKEIKHHGKNFVLYGVSAKIRGKLKSDERGLKFGGPK